MTCWAESGYQMRLIFGDKGMTVIAASCSKCPADVCILRSGLKVPIARLPAVLLVFINRPSGETECIYEANAK